MNVLKTRSLLTIAVGLLASAPVWATVATVPAVDGQIATLGELRWLSENNAEWGKRWTLVNNIDASDTATWNVGDHDNDGGTADEPMGFSPIGDSTTNFTGIFDGNGYTISNLYINRPAQSYTGLFGYVANGLVHGLTLSNFDVAGYQYTGVLAGRAQYGSQIRNILLDGGSLTGYRSVGGAVGYGREIALHGIETRDLDLSVTTYYAGGVLGYGYTSIDASHLSSINGTATNATASSISETGLIFGNVESGSIDTVTVTNGTLNISGSSDLIGSVGGYVGFVDIQNVDAEATITAPDSTYVGGVFGMLSSSSAKNIQFKSGNPITAYSEVGGMSGYDDESESTNVRVEVDISAADQRIGGLAGRFYLTRFEDFTYKGVITGRRDIGGVAGNGYLLFLKNGFVFPEITATEWFVGGLLGFSEAIDVEDVHVHLFTKLSAVSDVGGVAGQANRINITHSSVGAEINATEYAGGLTGYAEWVNASEVSVHIDITANNNVGGLIATLGSERSGYEVPTVLEDISIVGKITASDVVGGITPSEPTDGAGTPNNNVYSTRLYSNLTIDTGGVGNAAGLYLSEVSLINPVESFYNMERVESTRGLGEAKTEAEMNDVSTYANWDFVTPWSQGPWKKLYDDEPPMLTFGLVPIFTVPSQSDGGLGDIELEVGETYTTSIVAVSGDEFLPDEVTLSLGPTTPSFVSISPDGLLSIDPNYSDIGVYDLEVFAHYRLQSNRLPMAMITVLEGGGSGGGGDGSGSDGNGGDGSGDGDLGGGTCDEDQRCAGSMGVGTLMIGLLLLGWRRFKSMG